MKQETKPAFYGLLAEFKTPEELVSATHAVHKAGFRNFDAYSPFPIEEVSEAMEIHHSPLPLIVLIGGVLGCLSGLALQYYACVISYPLNIGGRPFFSWPSFIPVCFELTILFAAFSAVFGMLALNGLPMPYHPVFNVPLFEHASRDRFFVCIQSCDPKFDLSQTKQFLQTLKPNSISEVEP